MCCRSFVGTINALPIVSLLGCSASAGHGKLGANKWPMAGWPRASPTDLHIDPALPDRLARAGVAAPRVTGIVIVRHGVIAAEYYAAEWTRRDPVDIRSCTKSVVSALVGRALVDDLLPSLSVTIGDLIPERIPPTADRAVAAITLRSLLTMTAGLEWDWRTDYDRLELRPTRLR